MFPVIVLREKTTLEMCPNTWFHPADAFAGDGRGTSCVKHVPSYIQKKKKFTTMFYVLHLKNPSDLTNPPKSGARR